jgi:hypothetical protein
MGRCMQVAENLLPRFFKGASAIFKQMPQHKVNRDKRSFKDLSDGDSALVHAVLQFEYRLREKAREKWERLQVACAQ